MNGPQFDAVHPNVWMSPYLEVKCELSSFGRGAPQCVKVLTWRLKVNCPQLEVVHQSVSTSLLGG